MDILARKYPEVPLAMVRKVISESKFGIFTEAPKKVSYRHVDTPLVRGNLAIDLAYFSGYFGASKVLVAHCLFSKLVYLEVLRRISGVNTANAMRKVFDRCGFPVISILTDKGTDLLSEPVKRLLKERDVRHIIAGESFRNKSFGAERSIRTLRAIIRRLKFSTGENNLYKLAKSAEKIYNSTEHTTTKLKPFDLDRRKGPEVLLRLLSRRKGKQHPPALKIGSTVRLKRTRKKAFEKGSEPSVSVELFRIVGIKPTSPYYSYKIAKVTTGESVEGFFLEPQLRVATKEK